MPSFSGTQKGIMLTKISQFIEIAEFLSLNCFEYSVDIENMYYWDLNSVTLFTRKPPQSLAPFKVENTQLVSDISFWQIFVNFDIKNQFNVSNVIDIQQSIYQNILAGLNQLIGWCEMVKRAYLTNDIPCYRNSQFTAVDILDNPVTSETPILSRLLGRKAELSLPATPRLTENSKLAMVQTLLQGKKQIYFTVEPYREKVDELALVVKDILDILNSPTPEQLQPITPVQIDATGTRRLLQAILDFQTSVTITFQKQFDIARSIYGTASFILLYLREDTKKDLQKIIENTEDIIGGNPDEIGVTSLNQIRYIWLVGSDGNYYPVPPVESTDTDNDVFISKNNGILAGLKRSDENSRWRYQRINDVLYEINTNNNINKAYLDDLSPRIQLIETKVTEIQTKQLELEIKINEILTKVNTL